MTTHCNILHKYLHFANYEIKIRVPERVPLKSTIIQT